MENPIKRLAVVAAVALVAAGFCGGFLTAKLAAPRPASAAGSNAGGFSWPFFGKPRAANAPRAIPKKPDGFAVWTTRTDVQSAGPRDCIRFSRALNPLRSYGDFVTVSPTLDHPPAVTVQGDELCVSGVGYEDRTITLAPGLPALDGSTLTASQDVSFEAGSKAVYVGFSGNGVILPRQDSDGVGLETVNVSRLHLEVWSVADRDLVRKSISAPDPTPEGGYDYDDGDDAAGDDGRQVWSGDMDVHGAADQKTVTVFPLGSVLKTLKPGAYVITAKDASGARGAAKKDGEAEDENNPASARRWILFTDMALQAYDGSDALDVTVRSLQTAKPMAGVKIALVGKDGGDLDAVTSGADGRVHFARALLAGESGAAPARVMAYGPQGDFTVMDLEAAPIDLSNQDVGGRTAPGGSPQTGKDVTAGASAVDGFVYADRGVYRPGETVHLVALLRDQLARAVKDRKGALVIRRPSGLEFSRTAFTSTPAGDATQDLVLPANAPRGMWSATLEMEGSNLSSGKVSFQVEDFAPQRLAVTIAAQPDKPVLAGEKRPVQISANFLYGAIGSGLAVQSDTRFATDTDPFPAFKGYRWGDEQTAFAEKDEQGDDTVTDGAGHAVQVLTTDDVASETRPLVAQLTASVFEPGGRPVSEEADLKVRLKPLYLGVKPTTGAGDNATSTFDVIAVDPNGKRIAAPKVHYRLVSEVSNYDWYQQNGSWTWRRTTRDIPVAEGFLNITAARSAQVSKRLGWGDYRLELDDQASGAHSVIHQSAGWGEPADGSEPPDSARISPIKTGYHTGDTVQVRIEAPFAGEAEVAVARDRLITSKFVSVPKGGATISLKSDASWGGGAYVLVTVIQPRDPVQSPKPRRALGVAYVPLDPSGQKLTVAVKTPPLLDSSAPVSVGVTVGGLSGGEKAHVTVAAVDEGILRLTHQANPDPIGWYFGKRALGLNYRDDYGRLLDPNLGPAGAIKFGGDEVGGASLSVVPIKSVALWSGVVTTDASGKATVNLPAGDFNGQLRLVAVAWTDKAVGSGVSDVTVRRPVVAELALPRFLAPGDRAQATLELNNVAGKVGAYQAAVTGSGGLSAPAGKTYTLSLGQRITDSLMLSAPMGNAVGAFNLKVTGPGFSSTTPYPIQTRIGWSAVTQAIVAQQKPGEAYTPPANLLAGFAPDAVVTVSYSPFRGFDPSPVAAALLVYPYNCSEQLVSTGYPLLYPDLGTAQPKSGASLNLSVEKLLDREGLDGSFGLWRPGDGAADPWIGAYITDFLLQAKAQKALVPDDALARAVSAMKIVSKPDGFSSLGYRMNTSYRSGPEGKRLEAENTRRRSRASAYALYDLAKAGQGDLPRLRWFHDVGFKTEKSPLARAQIGAGLAAMGDKVRAHDSFVQAIATLGYKDDSDYYASPLRDLAGVVALAYEAGETNLAVGLQGRLENSVQSPDQLNTQEESFLLKAAHAMLAASGPVSIQASGVQARGARQFALGRLADARLINTGRGPIWRTVTISGTPVNAPPAQSAGMRLSKQLLSLSGAPLNPSTMKQGDRAIIRLSGAASAQRDELTMIDDALPAGFEIETVLTAADSQGSADDDYDDSEHAKPSTGRFAFLGDLTTPSVQEARDDRYIAALTQSGGKGFTLAYLVRAVTPGDFFLPGAQVSDMYRPAIRASTAPSRVQIARGQ